MMMGCSVNESYCYYNSGSLYSYHSSLDNIARQNNLGQYRDVIEAKKVADELKCPWQN